MEKIRDIVRSVLCVLIKDRQKLIHTIDTNYIGYLSIVEKTRNCE